MDIRKLQKAIIDGLEDVKAQDIVVFDTEPLSPLFERVIIASGTSNRQTKALAASVRDAVKNLGEPVPRVEGEENGEWIIVDCGAAVAHIMQPAIRDYYHLEEIWGMNPVALKSAVKKARAGLPKAEEPAKPVKMASAKKAPAKKKPAQTAAAPSTPAKRPRAPASKAAAPRRAPAAKQARPLASGAPKPAAKTAVKSATQAASKTATKSRPGQKTRAAAQAGRAERPRAPARPTGKSAAKPATKPLAKTAARKPVARKRAG